MIYLFFQMASANYYRTVYDDDDDDGIKNRCIFASVDVHGTYTNVIKKISSRNCVLCPVWWPQEM